MDLLSKSWNAIVYAYFVAIFDLLDIYLSSNFVCICIVCGFLFDYHMYVSRK